VAYGTGNLFPKDAKIIQIEDDFNSIGKNRHVDLGLPGAADLVLNALSNLAKPKAKNVDRFLMLREAEEKRMAKLLVHENNNDRPIHPYRFAFEVAKFVDDDTIVVGDGGNIIVALSKVLRINKPGHWMDPGPLGCLGVGPSFALTAKLLNPDKKVLLVAGDGSIGFNGFEIDTAARFNLPFTTIIGNDGVWGQVRNPVMAMYGKDKSSMCELSHTTNYEKLGEVFGGVGIKVEDPNEIGSALKESFNSGKVGVINVINDPDAMFKMGEGGYAI